MGIKVKRVYDKIAGDDGYRVLVDRLWPRGLTKDRLRADAWMKDLAPSTELRKWSKGAGWDWQEFKRRYRRELDQNQAGVAALKRAMSEGSVTLLYASRDPERNHAVVLMEYLTAKHWPSC